MKSCPSCSSCLNIQETRARIAQMERDLSILGEMWLTRPGGAGSTEMHAYREMEADLAYLQFVLAELERAEGGK